MNLGRAELGSALPVDVFAGVPVGLRAFAVVGVPVDLRAFDAAGVSEDQADALVDLVLRDADDKAGFRDDRFLPPSLLSMVKIPKMNAPRRK